MASVVSHLRILPADVETNLDSLKEAIQATLPPEAKVYKFEEEPIAFGLRALHVHIVTAEDAPGLIDKVEETIKNVEGVSQVDTVMVRRVG